MIDIVSTDASDYEYAILICTTAGGMHLDYFKEYPDLRVSMLIASSNYELTQRGIAGYVVLQYTGLTWKQLFVRATRDGIGQLMSDYIARTLDDSWRSQ